MDIGLIIILSICAAGLFAVVLSSRMRADTKSKSSVADDVLNYGRGSAALYAMRAEQTGVSMITFIMLGIVVLAVTCGGISILYYHLTTGLTLIGAGMFVTGFITFARYWISFWRAISLRSSWVVFANKKSAPRLWFAYLIFMSFGLLLIALGLVLEVRDFGYLTLMQAAATVLIPASISALLNYWHIRRSVGK